MLDLMPRAAAALASATSRDAADLLDAVLADPDTAAARAVARLGLDARVLVAAVAAACSGERGAEWGRRAEWRHRAEGEARRRGHGYIGTEHLLLGLLDAEPVVGALAGLGSSARAVRGQVHRTLCDAAPGGEWRADGPGSALGEVAPASHPALAAIAAEEPVAGLSWANSRDDREALTAAYGWADQFRGVPVTADTRFRAGSGDEDRYRAAHAAAA